MIYFDCQVYEYDINFILTTLFLYDIKLFLIKMMSGGCGVVGGGDRSYMDVQFTD